MKSVADVFAQKKLSKDIFHSEICYGYDYLVIGAGVLTMQELIVFLASHRPCSLCLSDFEITRTISNSIVNIEPPPQPGI